MNQNVPFVWRKNYQNEVGSNEELLETAHEKARQYLSRAAEAATRSNR
jgi:transposase-like protein